MIGASAVVTAGLLATLLLRKQSAALRHWVLACALACAALVPILQPVVPTLEVPISVPWTSGAQARAVTGGTSGLMWADGEPGTKSLAASLPPDRAFPVWLAGAIASLCLLLLAFGRLLWLTSRARPVADGTWRDEFDALAAARGRRRTVQLLQSDHPALLITWGLTRPKIILPRDAHQWPADRIRAVLAHEMAHVERCDWALQMLAESLRCVYWFNPLLWIACHRLRHESEQACDAAVLRMGVDAPEYATHLLDVARAFSHGNRRRSLFPAPAMARRSHLERRVRVMLNTGLNRAPLGRVAAILVAAGALAVAIPAAGVVAASVAPSAPQSPQPAVVAVAPADNAIAPAPAPSPRRTSAQAGSAGCSGIVVDAMGRPMPGVEVMLINVGTTQKYGIQTDGNGEFTISGVPAGEYKLELQKPGFMKSLAQMTLTAGAQPRVKTVAQIGSLQEMVVVSNAGAGVAATARAPRRPAPAAAEEFDPCSQSAAGGCLTQPRKLVDVKPVFPPVQAANGVSGQVVVEAKIGTDGLVKDMVPGADADPAFAAAAMDAIRQWEFSPVKLNGVPQECRMTVIVIFKSAQD